MVDNNLRSKPTINLSEEDHKIFSNWKPPSPIKGSIIFGIIGKNNFLKNYDKYKL